MPPQGVPARGIVSQPSVSMNLIRADTIPVGSEIWAEDEADGGEEVWMLAQVVRQENTLLTVRKKKTGEELEIDLVSYDTYHIMILCYLWSSCCAGTKLSLVLCGLGS